MTAPEPAARPLRAILGLIVLLFAGPFAQLYARKFFGGIALLVFVVMFLFEAVFLAERFPMVFRLVFEHHADPVATAMLFLFNSTQVVDLALAIAVLMAVYWTTLRMRESRELLVLVAAGTGPYQLVMQVLTVAVLALMASLTVSGVLDPAARFGERRILFDAEFRALRTGINTGQFYSFPNRVAFAPARQIVYPGGANQTRGLFVFEELVPGKYRVTTADHATLVGPDASGKILMKLGGFSSQTFTGPAALDRVAPSRCIGCGKGKAGISRVSILAGDLTQVMPSDALLAFLPRGTNADELTVFDEFAANERSSDPRHREDMRLLGGRLARSFLCLLAPLIALAAVCLTTRKTNYFALPLACMGLMALNITSEWLIRIVVPLDPAGAVRAPALVTIALGALLLTEIVREQGKLAQPQLARP